MAKENKNTTEKIPLKQAIAALYDMELNNYLMAKTIQELDYKIADLGKRKYFPHYDYENPRKSYECENPPEKEEVYFLSYTIIITIITVTLGACIGVISTFNEYDGFVDVLLNLFSAIDQSVERLFGGGIIGLIIGILLGLIIDFITYKKDKKRTQENYEEQMRQYEQKMRQYEQRVQQKIAADRQCVEEDKHRVKNELKYREILIEEKGVLTERRTQAETLLKECYISVGIDQSYRNLIPIGKMNEIISLNITHTLGGNNGLYDRVRHELREDAFYAKLDEIIDKLDDLIGQNDRIYGELVDMNYKCNILIEKTEKSALLAVKNNCLLSEAVKNTSIAAYNTERIATEERYRNMMIAQFN